jgi:hypothetical protein
MQSKKAVRGFGTAKRLERRERERKKKRERERDVSDVPDSRLVHRNVKTKL